MTLQLSCNTYNLWKYYKKMCVVEKLFLLIQNLCVDFSEIIEFFFQLWQGIVDSSASKPALIQDTNYMVEKTFHIAPYLGAFGPYVMPQWPINGSKGVPI